MTSVRPSSAEQTVVLPRVASLSASGNNPRRSELLQGLLRLAAFLLEHPAAPVPLGLTVTVTVDGDDGEQVSFVRDVAGQIDAGVEWEGDAVVYTKKSFGPVTYRAFGLTRDALDRYQKVQVLGQQSLEQLQARQAYAAAVQPAAAVPNPFQDLKTWEPQP